MAAYGMKSLLSVVAELQAPNHCQHSLSKTHTHTHIRLRRASKIFSHFFCLQSVGEGTLKDIKQRGWIRRIEERKTKINSACILSEIQSANGTVQLFLHHSSLSGLHIWIKNTLSNNQLTEESRYSRRSENSLTQRGRKRSRFQEYKHLHDQTGKVLKRPSLGKLQTTIQMKRFIFTVR